VITEDIEAALQLEERLINVWPSVSMMMLDGWAVRFANGYSGRANSASAMQRGAKLSNAARIEIERLYANAGLKPQLRLTPVVDISVEAILLSHGYRIKDEARSMVAPFPTRHGIPNDLSVVISTAPSDEWLEGVCRSQPLEKRSTHHLSAIVSRIEVPVAFATLHHNGHPAAFGLSALDRGMAEIGCVMVDEALRGQGLGNAIMTNLMAWAAARGAHSAFLQVNVINANAIRLYEKLGFATVYNYKTMVRETAP
jgi:N-acetylglutamate synthase